MDAKDLLGHGNFVEYCETACGLSARTAQNYMKAATVFGKIPAKVSNFSPKTIYRLAFAHNKIEEDKFNEIIQLPTDDQVLEELHKLVTVEDQPNEPGMRVMKIHSKTLRFLQGLEKDLPAIPEAQRQVWTDAFNAFKERIAQLSPEEKTAPTE